MKHLPKSTPTEILNDPYGFTYKEIVNFQRFSTPYPEVA